MSKLKTLTFELKILVYKLKQSSVSDELVVNFGVYMSLYLYTNISLSIYLYLAFMVKNQTFQKQFAIMGG